MIGGRNPLERAKEILDTYSVADLKQMHVLDLKQTGLSPKQRERLAAALGMCKTLKHTHDERPQCFHSRDCYLQIAPHLSNLDHEEFWILCLNRSNRLIAKVLCSKGGADATIVDRKMVFRFAIQYKASQIVLVHNHPSGRLRPSSHDEILTEKCVETGNVIGVNVLDHIIVGDGGYYSFADEGKIEN